MEAFQKSANPEAAKTLSILIVDDMEDICLATALWLNAKGHRTYQAENGAKALHILHEKEIDLVISDINMPEMDGFNMTRTIRTDTALCGLPIILTSGMPDNKNEAIKSGATLFVEKGAHSIDQYLAFINQMQAGILSRKPTTAISPSFP